METKPNKAICLVYGDYISELEYDTIKSVTNLFDEIHCIVVTDKTSKFSQECTRYLAGVVQDKLFEETSKRNLYITVLPSASKSCFVENYMKIEGIYHYMVIEGSYGCGKSLITSCYIDIDHTTLRVGLPRPSLSNGLDKLNPPKFLEDYIKLEDGDIV